jgi:hypothetical protein
MKTVQSLKRVISLLAIFSFFISINPVFSQDFTNGEIARNLPVADAAIKQGDIVSKTDKGLVLSSGEYDKNIFGVVVSDPSLSLNQNQSNSRSIVSYGISKVQVTDQNGTIKKGDLVTTSKTKGVGMKATASGFVLGKAIEDLKGKKGQIAVFINIQYQNVAGNGAKGGITGSLNKALNLFTSSLEKPSNFPAILRYILAMIFAGGAFLFGYTSVVKAMRNGIDAVGRNPLAKRTIQAVLVMNLVGILIISSAGIGLALFIIFY